MTVDVEATETTVPALLESIERGDHVRLLKHGQIVGRVIPDAGAEGAPRRTPQQVADALAALAEMDALSEKLKLGPFNLDEFKADRDAGRR